MGYVELNTEAVAASGNRTAATSEEWRTLASDVKQTLNEARTAVQDATVAGAVEGFGSDMNPKVAQLAHDVTALGGNTRTAAHVMNNADADSNTLLSRHGAATEATGTHLNRPITA